MSSYRTFVIPYDFSPHARAALYAGMDLARHLDASCHLLHVVQPVVFPYVGMPNQMTPPPPNMLEIRQGALRSLEQVVSEIENAPAGLEAHVVESSNVPVAICQMAEDLDADLIVMGTHGRTGISHAFLGSVAERTLRQAPCPVLTVRLPREESS